MKTQKMKIETTNGPGSAVYKKIITDTPDYEIDAINEKRFERALRKASGFRGRGLGTMCDSYGRNAGNGISVHGQYEVYAI